MENITELHIIVRTTGFLYILKTEPSTQRPAAPAEDDPWQHPAVDLGVKPLSCRTPGWRICTGNQLLLLGHKDHAEVNDHNANVYWPFISVDFYTLQLFRLMSFNAGRARWADMSHATWEVGEWRIGNRRITLRPCLVGKQWLSGLHIFTYLQYFLND